MTVIKAVVTMEITLGGKVPLAWTVSERDSTVSTVERHLHKSILEALMVFYPLTSLHSPITLLSPFVFNVSMDMCVFCFMCR